MPDQLIADLESQRAAAFADLKSSERKFAGFGGLAGTAAGGAWVLLDPGANAFLNLGGGLLAGALSGFVIAAGIGWSKLGKIRERVEREVVSAIAGRHGLVHTWRNFELNQLDLIKELGLVPSSWDKVMVADKIEGTHSGRELFCWGAHMQERRTTTTTDSQGRTRTETTWVTTFRGRVYGMRWHQKFLGRTLVSRSGWLEDLFKLGGYRRLSYTDPTFEKAFTVFTTDGVEGHYLVHPVMVERFVALEASVGGSGLRGAFAEGYLFLVFDGNEAFDVGSMTKALDEPGRIEMLGAQVTRAFEIMDAVAPEAMPTGQ
jgi:hypothetical protein